MLCLAAPGLVQNRVKTPKMCVKIVMRPKFTTKQERFTRKCTYMLNMRSPILTGHRYSVLVPYAFAVTVPEPLPPPPTATSSLIVECTGLATISSWNATAAFIPSGGVQLRLRYALSNTITPSLGPDPTAWRWTL